MDDQGTGSAGGPARPPFSWSPPDPPTAPDGRSGAPANWPPPDLPTGRDVPEAPPNAAQRILAAFAWIVGILCVLFLGRVFPILGGSRTLTAYEIGQVIGTIVVAVLVGVFVRWVVVKVRRRGRILSPWILVVAILVLLLGYGRQPGVGEPAANSGPQVETYLTIGTPYSLTPPKANEAEQFKAAFAGRLGNYEVRRVLEAGDHLGFLIVANLGAESSADFRRGLVLGFEENEGAEAHESVVGTRSAVVGSGPTGSAVIWVEPPYVLSIYAIDEDSARLLAESVMASYETES